MVFQWQAVGPLGQNECYVVRLDVNPGGGDSFLQCDPSATGAGATKVVNYVLQRPGFTGPNYSGLLAKDASQATVSWYVQVVRDDGTAATGAYAVDGSRHKVTPLSPRSTVFQFPLFGNQ